MYALPTSSLTLGPLGLTSQSGAAIGRARARLMEWLYHAYKVHTAGGVMLQEHVPLPADPVTIKTTGFKLLKAAVQIESNVVHEWEILNQLELTAVGLRAAAESARSLSSVLYRHSESVVRDTPRRAETVAAAVGEKLGAAGTLYPTGSKLELPVEKERIGFGSPNRSQAVRGSTPWVQFWRQPILRFGEVALPMSRFANFYHEESQGFTTDVATRAAQLRGIRLYVLKDGGRGGRDKGEEEWTTPEGSRLLDQRFGVLGLAHRSAPPVMGAPIFRQAQPNGLVSHAQALVYCVPAADEERGGRRSQPLVWDTLAWADNVPEFAAGETYPRFNRVREPRVKLNWQAKLVPTTLLGDAVGSQGADVNSVLERTKADTPLANTH